VTPALRARKTSGQKNALWLRPGVGGKKHNKNRVSVQVQDRGFFVERAALFSVTSRPLFDERPHRAEIEGHFLKAAAALLPACKKAAAAFVKCGFVAQSRNKAAATMIN
jgi:hypothetical protein